uniref:Calmodulin binding transcription activator 2 n=1 Tax=Nothobranchius furzeri TaxID=105023 RepID=A0A8C6LUV4_NOTFU
CLPHSSCLPNERLRWNTNEEITSYLISFERHDEWLSCTLKTRPKNGSVILYNRKKVKYRKDGYCWKKRKDGKTTREDHMKLKVQGMENPDIVLVHYLNVPSLEDSGKCSPLLCTVSDRHDSARWNQDDLLSQLKPMFHSVKCSLGSGDFSIEELVQHLLDRQRTKPQPRTHTCLLSSGANIPHRCNSTKHRIISPKAEEAGQRTSFGPLLLSPALTPVGKPASPSPPASSPAPPSLPSPAVQTTLSLTLLPSPVISGLLLTPSSSNTSPPTAASLCSPSSSLSSSSLPPFITPAFDPDSFLNSPTQGQTYGGPLPSSSPIKVSTTTPFSHPTLSLSLSPTTSTPPSSVSPPSSLSSLSTSPSSSVSPPSSSLPPSLALTLSPTSSVEAEPAERGGEELDISFDSQFPDLISDLITEEPSPAPSPSSSFLPFPHPLPTSSSTRLASITDFSPEWSYPEGGVKVLITGPWSEPSAQYSCVFDQNVVPASLIQPGVLRCYCPAHEAGLVCLQVLESRGSVSSSVLFEYRARNASSLPSSQLDWLSLDDNQFRMSILERLEQMERRMAEMAARDHHHPPPPHPPQQDKGRPPGFRDGRRIVGVCERMMGGARWGPGGGGRLHHSARHRGMTLLHLAAAQGYTHLIHTLMHWRSVNSDSLDLEQEVDPLNVDHFSCTPLMWACALGHQRAAELLYGWNSLALGIPDSLGRLPLAVARSRGHTRLATVLEELHTQRALRVARDTHTPQPPPSPASASPDTGLSSSSSLPSPSDPSSPSPSSAYSSGPTPMDTSPSSPSSVSSSVSLPMSPPSPSSFPSVSVWEAEPNPALSTGKSGAFPDSRFLVRVDMAALAEQIIEATPERIKQEDFPRGAESPLRERRDNPAIQDTWLAAYLEMVDCHTDPPALALQRLRPPSSAAWAEFLNASANGKMERDFALLTLTDGEQRELYEAARIIQNAFRRYKVGPLCRSSTALHLVKGCIPSWGHLSSGLPAPGRGRDQHLSFVSIRGSFLTKKQDQAARKIMRFLRRCRHRIKELKQTKELERRGLTT